MFIAAMSFTPVILMGKSGCQTRMNILHAAIGVKSLERMGAVHHGALTSRYFLQISANFSFITCVRLDACRVCLCFVVSYCNRPRAYFYSHDLKQHLTVSSASCQLND
jgi:hypothetical protein